MSCLFSAPGHEGPSTDHFDGKKFKNPVPTPSHGLREVIRWQRTRTPGEWSEVTDAQPGPPPPKVVDGGRMRVTFINHATALVQMDGVNVLTDPIWSERCSPVSFAGPKRLRPPGIRFEELPPIHAVVISHNHYDHLDLPTLERLAQAHAPRIYTGLGNGRLLSERGVQNVTELDWWQSAPITSEVAVHAVPAQHFSGRGLTDRDATLWAGYVLKGPAGAAYFAGDTGDGPHFAQVAQRLGPVRLALLPIGAFKPEWFMAPVHISPQEAVKAHQSLKAGTSVAIHFGTFRLADDGQHEPVYALTAALIAAQVPSSQFWVLGFGEGRDLPDAQNAP